MTLNIELVVCNEELHKFGVPKFATSGSSGIDVRAMLIDPNKPEKTEDRFVLNVGEKIMIPVGFKMHIKDPSIAGFLIPRSGLGSKHGIVLANTLGVIDSDYQDEVMAVLKNTGKEPYEIQHGERIAQIVFMKIEQPVFHLVNEFSESSERTGGFRSTGKQ